MSPNGGEMFEHKTKQTIRWSDNIQGEVKIELLKGDDVLETLAESTPSTGSLEWEITDDYKKGDDYKIRVTSIDSSALKAESNEPFSIIKEYIITDFPYTINFDDLQSG